MTSGTGGKLVTGVHLESPVIPANLPVSCTTCHVPSALAGSPKQYARCVDLSTRQIELSRPARLEFKNSVSQTYEHAARKRPAGQRSLRMTIGVRFLRDLPKIARAG
jgi:hypothetical protein